VIYRVKPNDADVEKIQQELSEHNLSLRMVSSYPGVTLMEFVRK